MKIRSAVFELPADRQTDIAKLIGAFSLQLLVANDLKMDLPRVESEDMNLTGLAQDKVQQHSN
jgi:hypothetical protein